MSLVSKTATSKGLEKIKKSNYSGRYVVSVALLKRLSSNFFSSTYILILAIPISFLEPFCKASHILLHISCLHIVEGFGSICKSSV